MKECVAASTLLPLDNTADVSLRNLFTHKLASPTQQHDLLIGECDFKIYVQHMYLSNSSVKPTASYFNLHKKVRENEVLSVFPPGWYPDVAIIEGMLMINTTPLRIHTKMVDTKHVLVKYSGCYLNI